METQKAAEEEKAANRAFLMQEHSLDRDVRREGIESNALMRVEQMKNTMALTQMQIDAKMQAGQDASDLKRQLAEQNASLQKELHRIDAQSRERVAEIGAEAKKGALGAKEEKALAQKEQGQKTIQSVVATLRDSYNQLRESGGITDTEKGPLSNIPAGIASSGLGQGTGRLLGTKDQSLRNTIQQQRPLIMQAIMQATGMTAKQMDSNVELQMYLKMATDPTLDYQTNIKALDKIEELFGGGQPLSSPQPTQSGAAPSSKSGWSIEMDH